MEFGQGDIFETGLLEDRQLIIVFGHIGFNELAVTWREFQDGRPIFASVTDPFVHYGNQWVERDAGRWIVFVSDDGGSVPTDQLDQRLHDILKEAGERGVQTVIMNGVRDVGHSADTEANRKRDEHRAAHMVQFLRAYEPHFQSVKLISLNDIFIRPGGGAG